MFLSPVHLIQVHNHLFCILCTTIFILFSYNCLRLNQLPFFVANIGLRTKTPKPFSVSRNFGCAKGAVTSEISDCTEETAHFDNADLEATQDLCKDTVEELLSKHKDDISRLMKMERRLLTSNEFEDDKRGERWFPYLDKCKAGDLYLSSAEVLEAIDPYIMDARKERFKTAVNNRSYSVCLVIEGLSDFGNVSAVCRSADALGIQSIHVVSCGSSRRYIASCGQMHFDCHFL